MADESKVSSDVSSRSDGGIAEQVEAMARRARSASARLGELSGADKNAWILRVAQRLEASRATILEANAQDLAAAEAASVAAPLVKRLALSGDKWSDMLQGVRDVAQLPDPIGEIAEMRLRPNGLQVGRMRIPLGVIGMIYESRPNVTVDAAVLCVKAGNAVVLRGGSEALRSNLALAEALRLAARDTGLPEDAVAVVPTADRAAVDALLQCDRYIDLLIPRGGPGLIRKVVRESSIPVLKHDAGVCHLFLDASADAQMATELCIDSKIRQMAVCNGLETLLCHREAARSLLPKVLKALHEQGVEVRGCPATREVFGEARPADDADWPAEYLAPIVAVRVVDDLEAAINHVRRFGSEHTDIIVTANYRNGREWVRRLNSSVVGVNCSTAFSDGFRLGLGAEIGISTSKLHAFGPMGLEGLTTQKFVLFGDGQLRE